MRKAASDWFAATRAESQVHDSFTAVLGITSADLNVDSPNSVLMRFVMMTCDCGLLSCAAVIGYCHSGEGCELLKLSAILPRSGSQFLGKGNRCWRYNDGNIVQGVSE